MRFQAPKIAPITASSSGATAVVAAVAGKVIRVLGYMLTSNAAVNAKFQSATTDLTGLLYLGTDTIVPAPICAGPEDFWFETAIGEALNISLSGAVAVGGHIVYITY